MCKEHYKNTPSLSSEKTNPTAGISARSWNALTDTVCVYALIQKVDPGTKLDVKRLDWFSFPALTTSSYRIYMRQFGLLVPPVSPSEIREAWSVLPPVFFWTDALLHYGLIAVTKVKLLYVCQQSCVQTVDIISLSFCWKSWTPSPSDRSYTGRSVCTSVPISNQEGERVGKCYGINFIFSPKQQTGDLLTEQVKDGSVWWLRSIQW